MYNSHHEFITHDDDSQCVVLNIVEKVKYATLMTILGTYIPLNGSRIKDSLLLRRLLTIFANTNNGYMPSE